MVRYYLNNREGNQAPLNERSGAMSLGYNNGVSSSYGAWETPREKEARIAANIAAFRESQAAEAAEKKRRQEEGGES